MIRPKNNTPIVRNHMPYTYMALILSEYPDEVIDSYITPISAKALLLPALEMLVGEAYRLPRTGPGLKNPSCPGAPRTGRSPLSATGDC